MYSTHTITQSKHMDKRAHNHTWDIDKDICIFIMYTLSSTVAIRQGASSTGKA